MMKSPMQRSMAVAAMLLLGSLPAASETQNLTLDPARPAASNGQRLNINVNYTTSDGNAALTGIGARLHWDSRKLRLEGLTNVLANAGIVVGRDTVCQDDSATAYDDDPTTGCYVQVAWVDTDGQWPGVVPVRLFTASFTSLLGAGGMIRVTADTGDASLPLTISLCQSNPVTAACINPTVPTSGSVQAQVGSGETPTFSFFVEPRGNVAFDPVAHRIQVRFRDGSSVIRGSTSVAVQESSF